MKCSIPLREFNFLLDNSNLKMLETSFFVIYLGVLIYPSLYKSCRKEGSKSFVISSVTFTILHYIGSGKSSIFRGYGYRSLSLFQSFDDAIRTH